MLNKFNNKFQNKPFHSHGFAHAANSEGIGAVSPETFTQRQHVHKNRRHVGGYKDSLIANTHLRPISPRPDITATESGASEQQKPAARLDRRGFEIGIQSRKPLDRLSGDTNPMGNSQQHRFTEPRHRYNPYQ